MSEAICGTAVPHVAAFMRVTILLPKTSDEAFRQPVAPECVDHEIDEDAGLGGQQITRR